MRVGVSPSGGRKHRLCLVMSCVAHLSRLVGCVAPRKYFHAVSDSCRAYLLAGFLVGNWRTGDKTQQLIVHLDRTVIAGSHSCLRGRRSEHVSRRPICVLIN